MIFRRIRETAAAVVAAHPDALVIIDSPDFTHRVARRVRRLAPTIPILDYVSPSVWAWRPGRARAMRAYIDQVLAILPFEPAMYVKLGGPPCRYVGHPLIERIAELRPNAEEEERRRADPPVVLILPGSRWQRNPASARHIRHGDRASRRAIGPMEVVLPTVPHLAAQVREARRRLGRRRRASWSSRPRNGPPFAAPARRSRRPARSRSNWRSPACRRLPLIACRAVEAFIARLLRVLARLPSVILANLVIGENVVPELLQADCTPERLAEALLPLLSDTPQRQRQIEAFGRLDAIMAIGSEVPSAKAAAIVLDVAQNHGRRDPAALSASSQPC